MYESCTFFGHRDSGMQIKEKLKEHIENLIVKKDVKTFFVGNNGNFDFMAYTALKELKKIYNYIEYYVVLAYMPTERKDEFYDYSDTLLPDFIENVPPRYAIDKRNRWMIEKSNYVISYVYRKYGGAYKFYEIAKKKNKVVTNLAEK